MNSYLFWCSQQFFLFLKFGPTRTAASCEWRQKNPMMHWVSYKTIWQKVRLWPLASIYNKNIVWKYSYGFKINWVNWVIFFQKVWNLKWHWMNENMKMYEFLPFLMQHTILLSLTVDPSRTAALLRMTPKKFRLCTGSATK